METTLVFDVEDYTTPGRYGLDDIPGWMAEIMTEEEVTGTFMVIGGKARVLEARGRTDVIKAMARHEIGSHTDNGSHHPTLCESLAGLDWDEAVSVCRDKEGRHIRELERIFGVKVACLSRHGGNFASPHVRFGAELGLPFAYSQAASASRDPLWYCGALNFGHELYIDEKAYGLPRELDRTLERLDGEIRRAAAAGFAWHALFMAHPLMVKSRQYTDSLNYADGVNRRPWRLPEFVPERQVREARNGFRRMVRFLRDHDTLRIRSFSDMVRRFGRKKRFFTREELAGYAAQACRDLRIPDGEEASAAEWIVAWAECLAGGRLPARLPVREVLGPMEEPDQCLEARTWPQAELAALAVRVAAFARAKGCLPGNLPLGDDGVNRIGLGALFFLFAAGVTRLAAKKGGGIRGAPSYPRYPEMAMAIDARARHGYLHWSVFDKTMPLDNLCRQARLQAWTCKRALGT